MGSKVNEYEIEQFYFIFVSFKVYSSGEIDYVLSWRTRWFLVVLEDFFFHRTN